MEIVKGYCGFERRWFKSIGCMFSCIGVLVGGFVCVLYLLLFRLDRPVGSSRGYIPVVSQELKCYFR